ncbi:MAG: methylmalonyl-CoA mutase, partial [Planctomycetes bacterium]|nr:methylmalonyl-CoA mutase [Planctomycetota bacterium]
EKRSQVQQVASLQKRHADRAKPALEKLRQAALENRNIFEELMEASKCCTMGQMSEALYGVGGMYRRSM